MVGAVSDWPSFDGIRIDQRLGSEGVTESFLAHQESLGRKVVLKALKPNVLPSSPFALALRREAMILGELCHEHILRLHDFRCSDAQMWLVLEHLEATELSTILQKQGPLSPLAVASLGFMVASALSHCHAHGVVHRSVQPQCIRVAASGQLTLVGFVGAVKDRLPTAPELLDNSAAFAGSPYFSPEQVLGESVDARSDLFSLGVVLYEALTGKNPFASDDDKGTAQRIRKDKVQPVSRFVRGVPSSLERILTRCLEKMPQDRFNSADELVLALENLLREQEVVSTTNELERAVRGFFAPDTVRKEASVALTARANGEGRPLRAGILGLILACLLIVGGGTFLQRKTDTDTSSARRNSGRLELLPEQAGHLRIVATPWANVSIDGQAIGTTPLGRPIDLPAGTHYVQFEHPRASIERRTLKLSAGETVLLDVKMNVAPSAVATPINSAMVTDAGNSP